MSEINDIQVGDLISYKFCGKSSYESPACIGMLVPNIKGMSPHPDTLIPGGTILTMLTESGLVSVQFWSNQDIVRKIS